MLRLHQSCGSWHECPIVAPLPLRPRLPHNAIFSPVVLGHSDHAIVRVLIFETNLSLLVCSSAMARQSGLNTFLTSLNVLGIVVPTYSHEHTSLFSSSVVYELLSSDHSLSGLLWTSSAKSNKAVCHFRNMLVKLCTRRPCSSQVYADHRRGD